jgi:PCFT/HCP family folate transporter-like MFS transporter 1/3
MATFFYFISFSFFVDLLILCFIITVISLLYGIFLLDETDEKEIDCSNNVDGQKKSSIKKFIVDFFDVALIKDLIKALAIKRQFNGRKILLITFIVYFVNYCAAGDTLYATLLAKSTFNWISEIGYWISYDIGTTLIGTLLIVGVLSKWLHVSDALICVISVVFTLLSKPLMVSLFSESVLDFLYYFLFV